MQTGTSVLLGDHYEKFISSEVSSGRYNSVEEVLKAALRLLESEENKQQQLVDALIPGEMSGMLPNFDAAAHLLKLNSAAL